MKKRILSLFIVLSVLCFPMSGMGVHAVSENSEILVNASEPTDIKVYCTATLEDDFTDNEILVVMNNSTSEINKTYTIEYFGVEGLVSIEDLTALPEDANIEELGINPETYQQILLLTLAEHSKQNVLDTIHQLELHPDIESAEPNGIISVDWPEEPLEEVYASQYYHGSMSFAPGWTWPEPFVVYDQGAVNQAVLSPTTITDEQYGTYFAADCMVFTFEQETTISSMSFKSIDDGQFPTEYVMLARDAEYYSETYGFKGNPSDTVIAEGYSWPIVEGFMPEGGLACAEVSREGDTVTIELDEPITCVAVCVQAMDAGTTPWSCAEAHFYGEEVEPKPVYDEVYSSRYYHCSLFYDPYIMFPSLPFYDRGSVEQGILNPPTVTDIPGSYDNNNWHLPGDFMIFTFDRPTIVSSMSFRSIQAGQFPSEYSILYRPVTVSEDGKTILGNPTEDMIDRDSWAVMDGFLYDGSSGIPYTEVSREGDLITIELGEPITCMALFVQATSTTPTISWSCAEAHFYGDYVRLLGDADGDGDTKANDAVRALLHSVSKSLLADEAAPYADVNGDGKVNAQDAVRILLHCVDKQPIPNQIPNGV